MLPWSVTTLQLMWRTFYFCSWCRTVWKNWDRLTLFLLLVVLSVRWKSRFSLRTSLCSWPQPEYCNTNAAIRNCWVSEGLNSLNESSEPKKSLWFSGCTKEHSEFQILMRHLFPGLPRQALRQRQDPSAPKGSDPQPGPHVRITGEHRENEMPGSTPD